MLPADLDRLVVADSPEIHPAGFVYVRSRPDLAADRYERRVWLHDERAGARPLTAGPSDTRPTWSPAGDRIAFVRSRDDVDGVAVISPEGGEAEIIARFPQGVRELAWSPDGRWLAVVAVTWIDDGVADEERARRPRRLTRVPYRAEGRGWIDDRRSHLWLVDPSGADEPRCLTPGDSEEHAVAWAPDGGTLAFLSDRHDRRALVPGIDVWEMDVATGDVVRAVAERGNWHRLGYRPDGALHLVGSPKSRWPVVLGLHRREADGSLTEVTADLDRSLMVIVGEPPPMRWSGLDCIVGFEDAGRVGVVAVAPDGAVRHLVAGERVVSGFDARPDRMVVSVSRPSRPPELTEVVGERERRIGGDVEVGFSTVDPDHFRVPCADMEADREADREADTEIDVWVYLPAGEGSVPVLLDIHGGPASQYGFGFSDEFQILVGAGFGVVACNPRGSSGRGEQFLRAVTGDGWGRVDHHDVLAALDSALERHPRLDRSRQGVMGGSYGGFLTAWLLARETRFRSAVVERALLSWPSFAGTSDIGAHFPSDYTGAEYPRAWDTWWDMSPLATAHLIRTPTLIIHSEEDLRCPIEQAEQLFMALLRNGTTVEMLRFPGESHELSRSGSPRHRQERFEAIVDWHRRHLSG